MIEKKNALVNTIIIFYLNDSKTNKNYLMFVKLSQICPGQNV